MTGPPPPSIGDFVPELLCLGVDAIIASIIFGVYKATKNTIKEIKVHPYTQFGLGQAFFNAFMVAGVVCHYRFIEF